MNDQEVTSILKEIRVKNINRIIVGHLNVNSLAEKFDSLKVIIPGNIDIMVISESKLHDSYPNSQFIINGFSEPFRFNRSVNGDKGGGVLIYTREDIPCKQLLDHSFPEDIEGMFIELNFRKCKWLLGGMYHPPKQRDNYFFNCLGNALNIYNNRYDKILLVGDFNAVVGESDFDGFLDLYNLKNLVKDKTCFKSINKPTCIDLFLTNCPKSFQHTKAISAGMSDHHKMIITVMKTTFLKAKPREIIYRSYKNFDKKNFKEDLKNELYIHTDATNKYQPFENAFLRVLDMHAPIKKKIVRANDAPYMTQALRKAIATRSRLENVFHRKGTHESKIAFKKHKNFCSRLYKKERRNFYSNLDPKSILDNKKFWETVKPFLSDKGLNKRNITLIEGNDIIRNDTEIAETFNTFFESTVKALDINVPTECLNETYGITDPIQAIIRKYENHPSIIKINEIIGEDRNKFVFNNVELNEIMLEIKNLNPKKANSFHSIPAKLLIDNSEICCEPIFNIVNTGITHSEFDDGLKYANITPVHTKKLITLTKVISVRLACFQLCQKYFERIIQKQIGGHMDRFLSSYLCGYRKGYNPQHALLTLLEKWRNILDKRGYGGAILMDLSKAFDTLNHDLLLAKLHAYGFDHESLMLIKSYLSNRWQRTKINTSFSSWSELTIGVPQGSVLGPLLFNIFINDLFYLFDDIDVCNYADDTTLHACDTSLKVLMERLECAANKAVDWFKHNHLKLNPSKCHLLICGHKYECILAEIDGTTIIESYEEKLLGIYIGRDLTLENHVNYLCQNAGRKLNALARLCNILPFYKRKLLMNSFFDSQFNYCPLVWIFHSRTLNTKINNLHYRALKITHRDETSTFDELLKKDGCITIHHRNIIKLVTEMYKVNNNLAPIFMREIFPQKNLKSIECVASAIRNQVDFYNPSNPRSTNWGLETIRHLGPILWNDLPNDIKKAPSLNRFKALIKTWEPNCPCRLCKAYINQIGYVNISYT